MTRLSIPLIVRLCSDRISIEVLPLKRIDFRLEKCRPKLHDQGYKMIVDTPNFLILRRRDGTEATVRKDGRILVRNARSEDMAKNVATEILRLGV